MDRPRRGLEVGSAIARAALVAALLHGLATGLTGVARAASSPGQGVHFVYLVRHGAYRRDDNADERTANALSPLGHEQARLLGRRLAAQRTPFRALRTSDFLRARQTADDIGAALHMTPEPDTMIHECTPTPEHPEYSTYHGPEDIALCVAKLEAVWRATFTPTPDADTWDLLVCHGNVIRWLMLKSLGADVTRWYDPDTANAALTIIAIRPDGTCRLVTFNDTGHLPARMQTWAGRGGGRAGTR